MTGLAVLLGTGLDVTWANSSFGPAVCAIEGVGCPADNCFCDPDRFWAYSYWDGDAWQAYPVAAGQSVISTTGAVEGWRWGLFDAKQTSATPALAAAHALAWLHAQQDATSGGFGEGLDATVEVMLAMGANNEHLADWTRAAGAPSLADFVRPRAADYSRGGAAAAGKLAVAEAAVGRLPQCAQPAAWPLLQRNDRRLCPRQRLQCLGHPGQRGRKRRRAGLRRAGPHQPAVAHGRLGVAGRLWRRHQHHRAGHPDPAGDRHARHCHRNRQRAGFSQERPTARWRHRL